MRTDLALLGEMIARRLLRSRAASLTLVARNVATWTEYRGVDPETDYTASLSGDVPADFFVLGPPTVLTLRFGLTY